jgi:hypothetical protein
MASQLLTTYALISKLATDLKIALAQQEGNPDYNIAVDLGRFHPELTGLELQRNVITFGKEWDFSTREGVHGVSRAEYIAVRLIESLPVSYGLAR